MGDVQETQNIETGLARGDCGLTMIVAAAYLIFMEETHNYVGACRGSSYYNRYRDEEYLLRIR